MRLSLLFLLAVSGSLSAGEGAAYPLWDGHESVADYAKRVNLPPTQALDLGNGVKLELVLIPAGRFIMGTPEPVPVDEEGFHKKILTGQVLSAVSVGILLATLCAVIVQAIRKRQRPKFSLLWLLVMTVVASLAVFGGVHWRQAAQGQENALAEFYAAVRRYFAAAANEKPAHSVTLTQPFYMGKFVVTQEQYEQIMGQNRSSFKGKDNPVEWVSLNDAKDFCTRLRVRSTEFPRLPTEAEWEFACRAGTTATFYSGDSESDLARVAWYEANSFNTTHPVGQKEPNAFGLYDMLGNVWQCCQDRYEENYYLKREAENPQGPPVVQGSTFVMRGGSWRRSYMNCRSAFRAGGSAEGGGDNFGFRVVVDLR